MKKKVHAQVYGRVQGVGFRAYTIRQADHLGITGWVRNCPDGSVEILAEADADLLEQFLQAIRRGPSHASVRELRTRFEDAEEELRGFTVRW
ncbi:MAG: acylphosphatase [Armatimonadetes bacterium]|nr:acylphosphatase [Armatimonadota bacterium]